MGTGVGFQIFSGKNKGSVFFTKRKIQDQFNLKLYGEIIERVECFKYLGIWFDKSLSWATHIGKDYLKIHTNASKATNNRVGVAFITPDVNVLLTEKLNSLLDRKHKTK